MNRRSDERNYVRASVKLALGDEEELDAEVADHSVEGARLILDSPVKIGTRVRLYLRGDQFGGTVRYCTLDEGRGKYVVGVQMAP
ncbi:MAG: PilZ domain-containing protein [Acidobacteriota bacterium]